MLKGVSVVARQRYSLPLQTPGVRGVQRNLPSWVPDLDETLLAQGEVDPSGFVPSLFAALSDYQPDAHMASLTSNLTSYRSSFYELMEGAVPPDPGLPGEWYRSMAEITAATADELLNYRFFIDDGTFHTFLGSNERVYEVGANGSSLAEWLREMIEPGDRFWDNLDAGPPF